MASMNLLWIDRFVSSKSARISRRTDDKVDGVLLPPLTFFRLTDDGPYVRTYSRHFITRINTSMIRRRWEVGDPSSSFVTSIVSGAVFERMPIMIDRSIVACYHRRTTHTHTPHSNTRTHKTWKKKKTPKQTLDPTPPPRRKEGEGGPRKRKT